ncbi:hypothetical protein GCM10010185_22370 [Saccharothrix coeruleofusca]|uniref:Uncharacterized protein n=1 Tax=Saccharothrix coeruleofusca TaxID=33919 RepID=A0A918AKQ1_9PSEU|nr:hypothetical protein GCM10010185_22370 [Saccharothrix coeruleofusca]
MASTTLSGLDQIRQYYEKTIRDIIVDIFPTGFPAVPATLTQALRKCFGQCGHCGRPNPHFSFTTTTFVFPELARSTGRNGRRKTPVRIRGAGSDARADDCAAARVGCGPARPADEPGTAIRGSGRAAG